MLIDLMSSLNVFRVMLEEFSWNFSLELSEDKHLSRPIVDSASIEWRSLPATVRDLPIQERPILLTEA